MIDKFIKINTATGGPVLINAANVASVQNFGAYTQIYTSSSSFYKFFHVPSITGTHSIFEVAAGTTTADGTSGPTGQIIDSNASFTSVGILPGDRVTDQATPPVIIDYISAYDPISSTIVDDTTLNTQQGLANGVAYKIYSSNNIFDASKDFVSSGVQVGDTVSFTTGYSSGNDIVGIVSAVNTTTLTLQDGNGNPIANWNDQVLFERANDPNSYEPITYKVFQASDYGLQTAINAAIVDVLNNTTPHVVEVPIVVPSAQLYNV